MYFKKKTPKQLRFTGVTNNARIFGKKEQAQKYLDSLPAVKAAVQFSIEEYSAPTLAHQSKLNPANTVEAE